MSKEYEAQETLAAEEIQSEKIVSVRDSHKLSGDLFKDWIGFIVVFVLCASIGESGYKSMAEFDVGVFDSFIAFIGYAGAWAMSMSQVVAFIIFVVPLMQLGDAIKSGSFSVRNLKKSMSYFALVAGSFLFFGAMAVYFAETLLIG